MSQGRFRAAMTVTAMFLFALFSLASHAAPKAADGENRPDPEPVDLSEQDIERFIAAVEELQQHGSDYSLPGDGKTAGEQSAWRWAQGLSANDEALAIIKRHGFDSAEQFGLVTYSITGAWMANELEKNRPHIEEAKRQLAEMKGKLPPRTYEMMEQRMLGELARYQEQPVENRELVARYRDEIEAVVSNPAD